MDLTYSFIKKYALIYITLPMFIFFVGFLKWYVAVVGVAVLLLGLVFALKEPNTADDKKGYIKLTNTDINIIFAIVLLWTYLGGFNGFFYQSSDWNYRNAIFHDLVDYNWPVVYEETGNALVYYIGFWLPAALFGKFIALIGKNTTLTWFAARQALWIWSALGMFLVLLLVFVILKANTKKKRAFVTTLVIFFSGMDIVGSWLQGTLAYWLNPTRLHIEWWSDYFQFSSITTCLFWVFNQSIITWICVELFLFEKNPRNYLLIGMACFFSGPMPFVGLVICMLGKGFEYLIREIKKKETGLALKEIFSISNILLLLTVFPIFAVYFLTNTAVNVGAENSVWMTFAQYITSPAVYIFLFLEVGAYILLLFDFKKKTPLFYVVIISLFFIPFFHVGEAGDFCMRASLPMLFILMTYCGEYLIDSFKEFKYRDKYTRVTSTALAVLLILGSITPIVEFSRGIYTAIDRKTVCLEYNFIQTLSYETEADNFINQEPNETLFYRYLAK